MGGSRSTDVTTFGRIVKKCLPKTVRQCDISVYILLSVRFPFACVLSLCICVFHLKLRISLHITKLIHKKCHCALFLNFTEQCTHSRII